MRVLENFKLDYYRMTGETFKSKYQMYNEYTY